ncbi:pituitary-specific positive transcription factor 1 [Platysternon megacephalum]|uniref:Pituitary-specific positive transcription factor 1 n=1 Tax=Platysternon megacephalum TaxID=55544 RepID=A0A4D9DK52_9SAUR|nr:pituitary-specific positive transcription factor 1 [Platysternon megacephalum]
MAGRSQLPSGIPRLRCPGKAAAGGHFPLPCLQRKGEQTVSEERSPVGRTWLTARRLGKGGGGEASCRRQTVLQTQKALGSCPQTWHGGGSRKDRDRAPRVRGACQPSAALRPRWTPPPGTCQGAAQPGWAPPAPSGGENPHAANPISAASLLPDPPTPPRGSRACGGKEEGGETGSDPRPSGGERQPLGEEVTLPSAGFPGPGQIIVPPPRAAGAGRAAG